jgi:hypothetical protein
MITGLYMRQAGVECPEINMLNDVREALTVTKEDIE